MNSKINKRDKFISVMLNEVDNTSNDDLVIYYEDLTDKGKAKVLDAINNSDELLDIFGDFKTKESIEDSFYGRNGKIKTPLFITKGGAVRGDLNV